MDPSNPQKQDEPEQPRYLNFRHLSDDATRDGKPALNKYSNTLTHGHDFPGAQVSIVTPLSRRNLTLKSGNAVCGRRARQENNGDGTTRWNCLSLVGRKSVQVSFQNTNFACFLVSAADRLTNPVACTVSRPCLDPAAAAATCAALRVTSKILR
jgi:hypothetical protein